jgi:hypothetical protein
MPDKTPVYQFPYPTLAEPPDGPSAIGALALRVEEVVKLTDAAVSASRQTLRNSSETPSTGPANSDFAQLYCSITLTAGVWRVEAGVSVTLVSTQPDAGACALWDVDLAAPISDSTGNASLVIKDGITALTSRPIVLTVPTQKRVCSHIRRNGLSTLANLARAGGPATWVTAFRIA